MVRCYLPEIARFYTRARYKFSNLFLADLRLSNFFENSWTQVHFYSYYIIHYAALNYNGFLEFNSQIFG